MIKIELAGWIRIFAEESLMKYNEKKVGKWMYFFSDREYADEMCSNAVASGIVKQVKYTDGESGVACFYLNCDDICTHKKVILFFIENNLIKKKRNGDYSNISFKFDEQTYAGEYGNDYIGKITLNQFIDLHTGEWKCN